MVLTDTLIKEGSDVQSTGTDQREPILTRPGNSIKIDKIEDL